MEMINKNTSNYNNKNRIYLMKNLINNNNSQWLLNIGDKRCRIKTTIIRSKIMIREMKIGSLLQKMKCLEEITSKIKDRNNKYLLIMKSLSFKKKIQIQTYKDQEMTKMESQNNKK